MSGSCIPPNFCSPPDFSVLFPDLVGATGATGPTYKQPINQVSQNTDYTLQMSDASTYIRIDPQGATINIVVPPDSDVNFNVAEEIDFIQVGDGTVQFEAGAGVSLLSFSGQVQLQGVGAGAVLKKTSANNWDLVGLTQ